MRDATKRVVRGIGYALLNLVAGLLSVAFIPLLLVCAVTCLLGIGFWLLPIALRGLRLWLGMSVLQRIWSERLRGCGTRSMASASAA